MLAGGLIETVPVGDEGGDPCLVVPVDVKITTAGAVLNNNVLLAGGLLEAVPVGDEGGDHYLLVPVDVKVAIDRATSFYHWQSYLIECYSS